MPFDTEPPEVFRLRAVPPLMVDATRPPPPEPAGTRCSCGHGKQAHAHYRRGSDCALCDCGRFHRSLRARWSRSPR